MSKIKKRVLSGIQPSGKLHLGNYFGMMSRMINYQDENDLFCFIVNYHALTTIQNKAELEKNTINAALDFLALGMDPEWLVLEGLLEPYLLPLFGLVSVLGLKLGISMPLSLVE